MRDHQRVKWILEQNGQALSWRHLKPGFGLVPAAGKPEYEVKMVSVAEMPVFTQGEKGFPGTVEDFSRSGFSGFE